MDPYSTNQGAPTPTSDPTPGAAPPQPPQWQQAGGATRYFPPQAGNGPETNGTNGATGSTQYPPQATQPVYPVQPQPAQPSRDRSDRDRTMLATILIGAGVLFFISQFAFFPSFGDLVLLLIGGVFMYAYFTTKQGYRIGFLIPGAILTGLGVGVLLENFPFVDNFFGGGSIPALTLGLGFCAIWFFERRHWWALIPGGIIFLGGLSSMWRIGALWPLVLIGLGVYLLYDQSRRRPTL